MMYVALHYVFRNLFVAGHFFPQRKMRKISMSMSTVLNTMDGNGKSE